MRKIGLYPRLAITNLWKNRRTYLSFLLSAILTVFVFYTFSMIALNDGLNKLPGAQGMEIMMVLGSIVVALFALIFLFYANGFLMKRRRKELGLYAIVGLEKKHIARILFYETTVILFISLLAGIGLGISLSKLMFLLIQALMDIPTPLTFQVNILPLVITTGLFVAVFSCLLLYNQLQVRRSSPISLLQGQKRGEKEPKTRWLMAILGVVAMAAGYIIANKVGNPLQALTTFFVAVILVIIGTYALFTTGSIAILKMLRRNKGYYYRPRNFISISGMIYRMKLNAAGLAGICILSTMAIITIGTTVALYIGQESMIHDQYPMDHKISFQESTVDKAWTEQVIRDQAWTQGVEIEELYQGIYLKSSAYREGNRLSRMNVQKITTTEQFENACSLILLPLSEFNLMTGGSYTLDASEALAFEPRDIPPLKNLTVGDTTITIKQELAQFPIAHKGSKALEIPLYLVVKDRETALSLAADLSEPGKQLSFSQGFWWNTSGEEEALISYSKAILDDVKGKGVSSQITSIHTMRREMRAMYGGFLFMGVFLGLLFLMATTLIIYFKQVSEGYMDHDRFIILQQVGMSREEVKSTVGKQILSVFVLPIIVTVLHTWGALRMMTQMLLMFGLADVQLISLSIFGTAAVFAVLYGLVYMATARTYYAMVRMDG